LQFGDFGYCDRHQAEKMKKLSELWHSLTCGCHHRHHKQLWSGWTRLIFPLMTMASVAWFLFRVVPNPARAAYPCQQAAFPLMSAFVIWLLGLKAGLVAWLVQRKNWLKGFRRHFLTGTESIRQRLQMRRRNAYFNAGVIEESRNRTGYEK